MKKNIFLIMNCKICNSKTEQAFNVKVLDKYDAFYLRCTNCGFLFVQNPFWLDEAYSNAITLSDTGIVQRNLQFSELLATIINFCFDKQGKFLDFAGGYGLFTRMMRDFGFDFYWTDKYCENLFAKGFEHLENNYEKYEIITAFEVLEHLADPVNEIKNILSFGSNIIFSTQLLPSPLPKPDEWWYYYFEHGQHISFYTHKSLELLAKRHNLNFYSVKGLHFITQKKLNGFFLKIILSKPVKSFISAYRLKFKSKSSEDSLLLSKKDHKLKGS
jgi:hypothetical protein